MESTPTSRRTAIGLGIVSTAQLMLVLDATVVNVALPGIQDDLGFSPAGLSWVLNAYALAFGGLLLLGGRIGDTIGRLRAFEIGLATFVVASLLGGIAGTPELLVAARTLQGVGAALAAPSVLALITTTARTTHERNRGLALFSAVSSAGASLGLILGGILTDWGSWRWTLFVNVPIGIAVIVSARRFVAETPRQRSRFDVAGALTATLGSLALVSGFISAAERGWGSPLTYGGLATGVLLIAVFLLVEARTPAPLLPLTLLHDRRRGGALLTMALVVGGPVRAVLPARAVPPACTRPRAAHRRCRIPPADRRDLRGLARRAATRRTVRRPAAVGDRESLARRQPPLAEHVGRVEHVRHVRPRSLGAQRSGCRARLHAVDRRGPA